MLCSNIPPETNNKAMVPTTAKIRIIIGNPLTNPLPIRDNKPFSFEIFKSLWMKIVCLQI